MYEIAAVTGRTNIPASGRLIDLSLLEEAWHSLTPVSPETPSKS
jgi:hypothetical protein